MPEPTDVEQGGSGSAPSAPVSPLSAALGLTRTRDEQQVLSWEGLAGVVNHGTDREKEILHPMNGIAKPGEIVAVMGPSGAGKSCLLNALAGRSPGVHLSGAVKMNGINTTPEDRRSRCGYVMQEDALLTSQTPTEILNFAACLRLGLPEGEERDLLVKETLSLLGLSKCAENPIGSTIEVSDQGRVSGGEKKRVAIAQELLPRPGVVFLDEPTSGLDSYNAMKLIQMLRLLARDGCVVMCTIHQPSSEVFSLFDRVMLLANGSMVYDGPTNEVPDFFSSKGVQMPDHTNPADFALMKLQELTSGDLLKMAEIRTDITPPQPTQLPAKSECKGSFWDAMWLLTARDLKHKAREKTSLIARFGSAIVLNTIAGLLYFQVGTEWGNDNDVTDINSKVSNHFGVIFFMTINMMFLNAQPTLIAFVPERPVFIREYASGTYGVVPYVLSKILLEIPLVFLTVLVSVAIQYGLTGLQGNFGLLWLWYVLFALASSSISFALGAATTTAEVAVNLLPLALVPQILLSGFFVASEDIPVWIRWTQWICPMKYTVNLALITEFDSAAVPDNREQFTNAVMDRSDVENSTGAKWFYISMLIGMTIVLRVLAVFVLHRRAKSSFEG
eukprot:TRINITY_DN161_c0_g2_i1.p1 TRINITY_DN161_c0_g2~~TRINITY_DN161_c0_g2_i1.p1  ORF type:complete len:639 (+),score=227.31 TRINITY_DN161_c0_g2_i1:71-1918(+)